MNSTHSVTGSDGHTYEFVDNGSPMQGGMKDVYFSPDKSYVIAFFRNKQDNSAKDRLVTICDTYRKRILEQQGGEYWRNFFCWPIATCEFQGRIGVVVPTYQDCFFFKKGYNREAESLASIVGKEKEGKWFASAQFRNKKYKFHLDTTELGDWHKFFLICLKVSRAVRRLHAAGLAHSDLSYKNVLIDPVSGSAAIIDVDGLVVPGKFAPDVIGTPDFIAPEVLETRHLPITDPARKLPNIHTDRHALAVMIYMYLLYRHPLRGGRVNSLDPQEDEELSMGSKALFIEHPTDRSNRPKIAQVKPTHLPWADVDKLPYTICGPYLSELFERALIKGLHDVRERPIAEEWERALVKSIDLLQPCTNRMCELKWFVFDNTTDPRCPFCGTTSKASIPVLNLYSKTHKGSYSYEKHRIMVYSGQNLYPWHVNRNVFPNERLSPDQRKPVADFHLHNGVWMLVNRSLDSLVDKDRDTLVPIGSAVELQDGKKILLSQEDGGRLVTVQLVGQQAS